MDIRRAVDMLCRSYTSLSLNASTSTTRRCIATRRDIVGITQRSPIYQTRRPASNQASSRPKASAQISNAQPSEAASSDGIPDMYKTRKTMLSDLFPDTSSDANAPRNPPTNSRSQQSRTSNTVSQKTSEALGKRTSIDDFLAEHEVATYGNASVQNGRDGVASAWGSPQRSPSQFTFGANSMNYPIGSDPAPTIPKPRVISELDIHVRPRLGRSIAVDPKRPNDLGAKLRALDVLCSRNRIRSDFNRQKFHERPGLKRKRLASERWRRNFKQRFNNVIGRVNELRAQGW